jgi:S1-C subfamily serine protease
MKSRNAIAVFLLAVLYNVSVLAADLNTIMMEATCKIAGQGTLGTGFIIGKPDEKNPPKAFYTLVTADHVLRAAKGDKVVLTLRQKQKDESWKRIEIPVQIRNKKKDLWQKHPQADVAAMFVRLPTNVVTTLLTTDLLMDDAKLKEYELHPGLELLCLGYPFGAEANAQGFPILRSGRIASYPLIPTEKTKTFLFDFTVFRGNSGGPVYFFKTDPAYGGTRRIGTAIYGIMGLVVRERSITQQMQALYEKREMVTPLQLGEVIHARFIKELIESMGSPKQK